MLSHIQKLIFTTILITLISCDEQTPCNHTAFIDGKTYLYGELFSGDCISMHSNGEVKSSQKYKEGLDDGEWRFYYNNGQLETIGWFENGKRIKEWRYYFKNGNLKYTINYNEGRIEGKSFAFDSIGNKIFEGIYKNDSLVKTIFSSNRN